MVSIFTGLGAGFERGSASTLGSSGLLGSGSIGRNNEQISLNAATGNLLITQRDEFLVGRGPDSAVGRTYNSLEDVGDGDNNDHWRQSTTRGVHGLTGTLNTAGSTIKRDAGDGSVITYTWSTIDSIAAYYATDGAGAYDKLTYASGVWTWTDGDSQFTEKYEAHGVYGLTGTANTSGSTITRIKADGTSSVYSWDAATSKYIVSAGTAGADNLTYTGGVWTWSNSGNPLTQYYYANGANWRITELSDTASQKLIFSYLGATLDKVTTQDGSYEKYSWASGHITQIVTGYTDLATNTAKTLTRTRYGYDGSNRLTTVTVDLTPSDNTIADGKTYVTTYTYDSSGRISTITETDGTSVTITYDGSNRVATYVQTAAGGVTRTTSFSYDTTARQTTITDALNQKTVLSYDTSGNLTRVISPPNGSGAPQVRKFTYTANGEVASVNNGDGDITVYAYDSNGNRISQRDALGNTVTWAYQNNQLLTETHYLVPDTDGAGVGTAGTPQTTRYVYNTNLTVQYAISAGGTVTAYGYDAYGNRTSAIEYVGARYDVSALSTNQVPTAAALTSWIGTIAQGAARRTETSYDARGNIAATRSYAKLLSNGQFDTASEKTETVYAYDQAGNLLARRTFAGNASEVDVFAYDGLGRTISTSNSNGLRTTITFADASQTTTVTLANGSTQVSVYNLAGDLISYTEAGAAVATAVSTYKYDPLGRVKIATDPLGNRTYYFYDATGRKTAQVDPLGAITEYRYDVLGNLTSTTQYATRLTTTQLGTLVDGSGNPTAVTLASIRPSASTEDRWNFSIYDLSGRLVQAVDGTGATTVYSYDGASQLISTTQYATRMSATQIATLKAAQTNQWSNPDDGTLWSYDTGVTVAAAGTIDGANAYRFTVGTAGQARLFQTYLPVVPGQTTTLVITLMGSGTTTGGVLDLWGQQTAWGNANDGSAVILSGPGTLTPLAGTGMTVSGLSTTVATRIQITRTFNAPDTQLLPLFWIKANPASVGDAIIAAAPVVTTSFHSLSFLPAADTTNDRVTRTFYDADGNVTGALDAEGYLTQSVYDAGGARLQTIAYANATASNLRASGTFAELLASAGSATATTTTYKYDAIGRLKLTSDGLGNRTHYFYDAAGRKTAEVDSLGAVTEYRYNGEGSLTSTTRYATRLTAAQLGALVDGSGNPTMVALASVRPLASADDRWTFSIYDVSERLVQTIDEAGSTTVYAYDGASQLISTTHYANRIPGASIAALKAAETNQWLNPDNAALWTTSGLTVAAAGTIDGASAFRLTQTTTGTAGYFSQYATKFGDGQLVTFSITVKAVSSSSGIVTLYGPSSGWGSVNDGSISIVSGPGTISNLYSGNGWTISGLSTTAETRIQVTRVYNAPDNQIQAAMWVGSGFSATAGDAIIVAAPVLTSRMRTPVYIPTADAANDRVTRLFYDADGNVTGTLDAEGYLTQSVYDASGAKTQTIAYANATASALRASGTFAQLLASFSPDNAKDVRQWMLYDARGFLAASIDGEGNLTRYTYTVQGMVATRTRGQQLNPATLIATPPTLTTLPAAPAGTVLDVVSYTYDVSGRVRTQTQTLTTSPAVSTTTLYAYDRMGRLVTTTTQSGTSDPHVFSQRYDALGRLTSALNAEGNALLAANPSQIETIYANFGTTYTYDADSRLIAQTEGRGAGLSGARSLYYYNVDDTLAYVVDPSGAVTEYRYTAFGDRGDTILYAKRIVAGTLAGMTGGAATSVASTVAALANAALDSVHHADFNADGTIKSSTGPLGAVTTYAYNAFGELVTEIDPLDAATSSTIQTTRTYDRRGLLKTAVVDSASGGKAITSTYGYDAFGRAVTLTDPASQTSTKTYDRAGRLATATNALSQTTTYSYDGRGNLAAVRSPAITGYSDVVTRYAYDNAGRLVYTVDALGGVTQNSYDDEGRVVLTQSYATAISLAGLATVASASDIAARVTAVSGKDQLTRSVYDRDGQLRYSVDANNFLTEYVYDANGNAIRSIAYSTAITSTPTYSMATVATQIAGMSAPALAAARTTRNVYTASGQRSFTIDALGYVTAYTYDAQGNVVKQQRVAAPYAPTGNPTDSEMVTWLGTNGNTANDRISRAIYDQNGQLRFDVDAEGYVTQYTYDAAGNLRTRTRYADRFDGHSTGGSTFAAFTDTTTLAQAIANVAVTPGAPAAVTEFKYDSAGRLIETIDPEGTRTVMTLNQLGQALTTSVAYGTSDESVTTNSYDALGRMLSETRGYGQPEATTRVFTYDALGNMLTETRASGRPEAATTTYTYDALGHALTVTVPLNGSNNAITANSYDAFGNLVKIVDPRGNAGYFYYDARNQLTLQVDPEGYATATSYTFAGQTASVTRYSVKPTGTPTITTAPTVISTLASDAVSSFTYDKLGRVLSTSQVIDDTTAHNITESYGYNAFGDRTSVTNKLGGVTTNSFDKRGLLLSEVIQVASGSTITNTYTYDARGNLTQMVEASGSAKPRTTRYAYDKLDRLTTTTHDQVTVSASDLSSTSLVTPVDTLTYDRRGNVIKSVTAQVGGLGGAVTWSYYDDANRKIAEIDPLGTMSKWTYDGNGNTLTATVYGDAVTPTGPGGTPPAPVSPTNARTTTYAYDKNNRLVTTTGPASKMGSYNGTSYVITADAAVAVNEYDAAGNLVSQTDGRGNKTWSFYNKLGQKVAQVVQENYRLGQLLAQADQNNYLTTWVVDANGNVTSETRYANKITGNFTATSTIAALQALANPNATADRTTTFTYDLAARRLTETRLNVADANVSSTGALTVGSESSQIIYTYNALGEVLTKREANGDTTTYTYDAIGRTLTQTDPSYTNQSALTVSRRTTYTYDGLNNLLSATVSDLAGDSGGEQHVTTYAYAVGGRMTSVTDANGFTRTLAYDVGGHTIAESYSRLQSDGTSITEAVVYAYDLAGRVTSQTNGRFNGSAWVFTDSNGVAYGKSWISYNAYGEMVARGMTAATATGPAYQETFRYDANGRLWSTNSGDGVLKFFVYDKNGNQTLMLTSAGADLSALTESNYTASLTSSGGTTITGAITTVTLYDNRSQAIETRQPDRHLSVGGSSTNIVAGRTYNAFGEVASETNARGFTTTYGYNTMGRMITKVSPQVAVRANNGSLSNSNPTETYAYDVSGRLIATTDARGYITTRQLLAGSGHGDDDALVVKEFHADGGVFETKYDVFGNARVLRNELYYGSNAAASDELHVYDNLGRLVTVTNRGGLLTDSYSYDGLGQRIGHVQSWSGGSQTERTDYDAWGRIVRQIAFNGDTTGTSYVWSPTLTARNGSSVAIAAAGGWIETTTYVNGRSGTRSTDMFGHVTSKTDLGDYGGHTTNYTYDFAGHMLGSAIGSDSIGYAWLDTGQVGTITTITGGVTTIQSSGYDVAGNKLTEYQTRSGAVIENATATYDALNRLSTWSEAGNATTQSADTTYYYDANSNIMYAGGANRYLNADGSVSIYQAAHGDTYLYDSMNRMVNSNGALITYNAAGQRMTVTTYSNALVWTGWRASEPGTGQIVFCDDPSEYEWQGYHWVKSGQTTFSGTVIEHYSYTSDGRLDQVMVQSEQASANGTAIVIPNGSMGAAVLRADFDYDAQGRVASQTDYNLNGTVAFHRGNIVYNAAGQVLTETNVTAQTAGTFTNYITNTYGSGSTYALGAIVTTSVDTWKDGSDSAVPDTLTTNSYSWYDGAILTGIAYKPDTGSSTTFTTTITPTASGQAASVSIADGRPRSVSFVNDVYGQTIRRDEADTNYSQGDPHQIWYRFNGREMGNISNDGTYYVDYASSIADRKNATTGTGAFRFGQSYGAATADFGDPYHAVNSFSQGGVGGSYTVQDSGETLSSIAAQLWGDSNLWYKLAGTNGLSAGSQLTVGQRLSIPPGVLRSSNTAQTFTPYDPAEALGNTNPTTPKPQKKANNCGVFGQILLSVIAVAVFIVTAPFVGYVPAAMLGSAISQGVGVATGIQDSFSWKAVALAGVTALVTAGVGQVFGQGAIAGSQFVGDVVRGAAGSAITQGIGVATGLQEQFNWVGVAAAGVSAGAGGAFSSGIGGAIARGIGAKGSWADFTNNLLSGMAGGLTSAAVRSLATGTDFGDNLMAALPDVIGQTVGRMVADKISAAPNGKHNVAFGKAKNNVSLAEQLLVESAQQSAKNALTTAPAAAGSGAVGQPEAYLSQSDAYAGLAELFKPYGKLRPASFTNGDGQLAGQSDADQREYVMQDTGHTFTNGPPTPFADHVPSDERYLATSDGRNTYWHEPDIVAPSIAEPAESVDDNRFGTLSTITTEDILSGIANGYQWLADAVASGLESFIDTMDSFSLTPRVEQMGSQAGYMQGLGNSGDHELDSANRRVGQQLSVNQMFLTWFAVRQDTNLSAVTAGATTPVRPVVNVLQATAHPHAFSSSLWNKALNLWQPGATQPARVNPFRNTLSLFSNVIDTAALADVGGELSLLRLPGSIKHMPAANSADFVGPLIGKSGFRTSGEFAEAVGTRYQRYVDDAYVVGQRLESQGLLRGNPNTRLGDYVDRTSARRLGAYLNSEGIAEGPNSLVQMNRWLRDPAGSGLYVRPDVRIPAAGRIYDATVGFKPYNDTQIVRFGQYSGGDRITVVRPSPMGSYSIVP